MLPFTNETLYDRLRDEGREVDFLPFSNLDESVREGVRRIRQSPLLPDDFGVTGFVYDVRDGTLHEVAYERREEGMLVAS